MFDEAKDKIRLAAKTRKPSVVDNKGENNPMFGKRFNQSEEAKIKIGLAAKGRKCSMKGKTRSDEIKRKISVTMKRRKLMERAEKNKGNIFHS